MFFYRNTLYTLASHIFVVLQPILLVPILINLSSQELYAQYILLLSFLGILCGLSSLGFDFTYKRNYPTLQVEGNLNSRKELFFNQFWFQLFCSIFFSLLALIIVFLISESSLNFRLDDLWVLPVYIFSNIIFSQSVSYARFSNRLGFHNLFLSLNPLIFICSTLFLSNYFQFSLTFLFLVHSIVFISIGILSSLIVFKDIGLDFRFPVLKKIRIELAIGFPFLLTYLVETLVISSDRFLIALLLDVESVGYYVPAYILGSLPILIARVLSVVLPQIVSICVDKNYPKIAENLILQSKLLFLIFSIPFAFGSYFIGYEVLTLYTNEEIGREAFSVLLIISISSIFFGLFILDSNILFVRLKTKEMFKIDLYIFLFNFIFNLLLLFIFSEIIYAAIVTLLSYLLGYAILNHSLSEDSLNQFIEISDFLKIILCSSIMLLSLFLFNVYMNESTLYTLILKIALAMFVYFICIFFLFLSKFKESLVVLKRMSKILK